MSTESQDNSFPLRGGAQWKVKGHPELTYRLRISPGVDALSVSKNLCVVFRNPRAGLFLAALPFSPFLFNRSSHSLTHSPSHRMTLHFLCLLRTRYSSSLSIPTTLFRCWTIIQMQLFVSHHQQHRVMVSFQLFTSTLHARSIRRFEAAALYTSTS